MKIENQKLNIDWEADSVSSMPLCWEENTNVYLDFFLSKENKLVYKNEERVRIVFRNCEKYSFNYCNDEGFYRGQYRIKPNELEWGEFHELLNYNDRNFPKETIIENNINLERKHFIFFFKDETFEVIAESFNIEIPPNNIEENELLDVMYRIGLKIERNSNFSNSGYESYEIADKEIENFIIRIRKGDLLVYDELKLCFAPTGKFQELSIDNDWGNEYIEMSKIFDNFIK